ncbi:MAG: hypothetical protein QOH81_3004 [Sphingomonadales bacterium]|nr:hypothetical protein [Sphingomonadales bacterium]
MLLAALIAAGCTSSAEKEYRRQIECFALQQREVRVLHSTGYLRPGLTPREAVTAMETYRRHLIAAARELGKSKDTIKSDLHAYMAREEKMEWEHVHDSEERMERLIDACASTLGI